VHFDYNNHLGDNEDWRAQAHHRVIREAIQRYGYDASRFFDDQANLQGAVASIANAINQSSTDNRLFLICAGPMEVCWRGINAARDDKEPFVTVISHGRWNETHADTWQLKHVWTDIENDFNVRTDQIENQNNTAFRSDPWEWAWLEQQQHGQWLYEAVAVGRKAGDASDAGMVFYRLDGRTPASERATMSDIKAVFNGTAGGGATPPDGFVTVKAKHSRKCLQVANFSTANKGNIQQWACTGYANQRWRFEPRSARFYSLRARHSDKCMDVKAASTANGANVFQWRCHWGDNQQFKLEPMGDGWFRLKARHSNKCVTVALGSFENGTNVDQRWCHLGSNQQFRLN
jgi:hypothetical protein